MNVNYQNPASQQPLRRPLYLTDGGLETTLVFHEGWELPEFAAFPLLDSSSGRQTLRSYYDRYLSLAEQYQQGFVLEAPTWRASSRWGKALGYDAAALDRINREAIAFMQSLRSERSLELQANLVISGQLGPQDDAYAPKDRLTIAQAEAYHSPQIASFKDAGADQISALTLCYVEEAIGITRAAKRLGIPSVISFTVETDGHLPVGMPLGEAIEAVDAATESAPVHYMINCAHPDHFRDALAADAPWLQRIGALRANASRQSHEELDNAETLDAGNPEEFGLLHSELLEMLPGLLVVGGCCGTDERHVAATAHCCGARAQSLRLTSST